MKILLSPHADDETLFAAYTLLRENPLVVLCYPGAPRHGDFETRLAEFTAAMETLDCPWVSLVGYDQLEKALAKMTPEHVYAPLPEVGGNADHNHVGDLAACLWPGDVTFYTTYTPGERTTVGWPVPAEESWPELKREALACYKSQQTNRGTREHFSRPLDEYLVSWDDALRAEWAA